jgi:hypothetical protein
MKKYKGITNSKVKYNYGETSQWKLGLKENGQYKKTRLREDQQPGPVTITYPNKELSK